MDHAANDVSNPILIYNAGALASVFVSLIIQTKGRDLHLIPEACPYYADEVGPVIDDNGVVIRGIDRIIDFLEHKYPAPPLTPDEPSHRVAARMIVDNILESYPSSRHIEKVMVQLEPPAAGDFLLGRTLSLVDLALYPLIPLTRREPGWYHLRSLIDGQLR